MKSEFNETASVLEKELWSIRRRATELAFKEHKRAGLTDQVIELRHSIFDIDRAIDGLTRIMENGK